jgi:RHS repeat-associated protein
MKTFLQNMNVMLRSCIAVMMVVFSAVVSADLVGTPTYYHNNFSGSPIAATDANAQLIWDTDYLPHGEKYATGNAAGTNKAWFTGHVQDAGTGLVYMQARYYDPEAGRFYGVDPAEVRELDTHSFNRYAYGNNNPYKFFDPDGRSSVAVRYRDQPIHSPVGIIPQFISGGHSGVVAINDKSGGTKYREFGRYNETDGLVRPMLISDLKLGENGVPTKESLEKLLSEIRNIGKKSSSVDIQIEFKYGGDFDAMMRKTATWSGRVWNPLTNSTCHSFCDDVVKAGGSDSTTVSGKIGRDNTELIKRIQDSYPKN